MASSGLPSGLSSPTPTMKLISVPQGPPMTDRTRLVTAVVVGISLLLIFGWQADVPFVLQIRTTSHASITNPELWLPPEGGLDWKPCVKKKEVDASEFLSDAVKELSVEAHWEGRLLCSLFWHGTFSHSYHSFRRCGDTLSLRSKVSQMVLFLATFTSSNTASFKYCPLKSCCLKKPLVCCIDVSARCHLVSQRVWAERIS